MAGNSKAKYGMTHRRVIVTFGIVVAIAITTVLVGWSHVLAHRKLEFEVDALGNMLLLFAEDNGRMPKNIEELYMGKYLERTSGYPVVGPSALGRVAKWGLNVIPIHFQYLSKIEIGFEESGKEQPALRVKDKNHIAAQASAYKYSEWIRVTIEETTATQPAVP